MKRPTRACAVSFVIGGVMLGCNSPKSSEPPPSGSSATTSALATPISSTNKRLVDATALHAQCLLSSLRTPPRVETTHWLDVGVVEADGVPFGWLIVEQADRDVALEDARFYLDALGPLEVVDNASRQLCASEWEEARARSVLTAVVRVGGGESKGTFAILGGRADALPARGNRVKIVEDVPLAVARRLAFGLAAEDMGAKLVATQGPSGWSEAVR